MIPGYNTRKVSVNTPLDRPHSPTSIDGVDIRRNVLYLGKFLTRQFAHDAAVWSIFVT